MDQRGHGLSDHASDYSRAAFVGDIAALLDHLHVTAPVVLVGNSLGGTNAFFFAARHPDRVRAMVIEEGPPEEHEPLTFVLDWRGVFPTRSALEQKIGERLAWSMEPSFRETAHRWTLAFDPADLVAMQKELNGDFWREWLGSSCPALVVRGRQSRAVDGYAAGEHSPATVGVAACHSSRRRRRDCRTASLVARPDALPSAQCGTGRRRLRYGCRQVCLTGTKAWECVLTASCDVRGGSGRFAATARQLATSAWRISAE